MTLHPLSEAQVSPRMVKRLGFSSGEIQGVTQPISPKHRMRECKDVACYVSTNDPKNKSLPKVGKEKNALSNLKEEVSYLIFQLKIIP
jgi:hypothetical protein